MPNKNSGLCPSFFRAQVATARRGRSYESEGYSTAGYTLAGALRQLLAYVCEAPDELVDAALGSSEPEAALWELVERELPRCAALVPSRRRVAFLRGFTRAIEAGGTDR